MSAKDRSPLTMRRFSAGGSAISADLPGLDLSMVAGGWHSLVAVGSGGKTRVYLDGRRRGAIEAQCAAPVARIGLACGGMACNV